MNIIRKLLLASIALALSACAPHFIEIDKVKSDTYKPQIKNLFLLVEDIPSIRQYDGLVFEGMNEKAINIFEYDERKPLKNDECLLTIDYEDILSMAVDGIESVSAVTFLAEVTCEGSVIWKFRGESVINTSTKIAKMFVFSKKLFRKIGQGLTNNLIEDNLLKQK